MVCLAARHLRTAGAQPLTNAHPNPRRLPPAHIKPAITTRGGRRADPWVREIGGLFAEDLFDARDRLVRRGLGAPAIDYDATDGSLPDLLCDGLLLAPIDGVWLSYRWMRGHLTPQNGSMRVGGVGPERRLC
jgi:hypothetical protein